VSGPPGAGSRSGAPCARTKCPQKSPARCLLFLIGLLASLALPASAAAIDEFPVPNGGNPGGIAQGPDGALWFTQETSGEIGRITTAGVVTNEFPVTSPSAVDPTNPAYVAPIDQITSGPDGRLWFTMPRDNAVGAITTGGAPAIYDLDTLGFIPDSRPEGITAGPDGNIWFTEVNANQIGGLTPSGARIGEFPTGVGPSDITSADGALWFTEAVAGRIGRMAPGGPITPFPVPTAGSGPSGITAGPGGLWFTESNANAIGLITTSGLVTEFGPTLAGPSAIAEGQDRALWFTESEASAIGRITSGGAITNHIPVPTPGSEPSDIAKGPDGALWFTEFAGNKIGRIDTAPPPPPLPPVPPPRIPITVPTVTKKPVCKVPKVKRLSVAKAKKKLKKARCKFRVRGRGFVMSTKPKAGKRTTKTVVVKAKPKKAKRGGRSSDRAGSRP
jgi:virginiamycin B lyase